MTNKELRTNLAGILLIGARHIKTSKDINTTINIIAECTETINAALLAVKQGKN